MTVHDGKEKSTNWKGTELHELLTPTAQCITKTGKFLDSEHPKEGNALGGETIFKCERINLSHLLCLLRLKFPVLARHAVVF